MQRPRTNPPAVARAAAAETIMKPTRILALAGAVLAVASAAQAYPTPAKYTDPAVMLTLTPDQQLSVYAHLEATFPVKVVRRGARVSPLPRAHKQITPQVTWQGATLGLDDFMAATRMTGVLAIKDGRVVMERYALGRKPEDRWETFSVAKSVTSTLIGAAIKDGRIKSLNDPVTDYIPELKGSGYDGVTIRQLVTMTSGVKWNEDYTDPKSDVALSSNWPGEPGMEPLVSYMRRLPREAEPGTKFAYKTGETDLAGILLERAVHEPISQYFSEKIWLPSGMERDAIWMTDRGGLERGGCCLAFTLRDYGRLALFIAGGGVVHGRSILPDGWLAAATTNQVPPPNKVKYGYFWWVHDDGYEALGIFGQSIRFTPKEHLILVINSAAPTATGRDITAAHQALLDAVEQATK
jgi:CubicO group peptidase (beta-lactamase class C family)